MSMLPKLPDWIKLAPMTMPDGVDCAKSLKKNVLGAYVRGLESIDPKVAAHLLTAQREFFAAGRAFFEAEMGHADKAIDRIRKRAEEREASAD